MLTIANDGSWSMIHDKQWTINASYQWQFGWLVHPFAWIWNDTFSTQINRYKTKPGISGTDCLGE